ncbi:MAG: Gfo/Idh/MocA family oxidoreductase [bacterium]|nr:Gfo/Idh/MocA family oxidoreductase [bacterium]
MKPKQIRIGVIGVGAIGPSHVFSIKQVDGCQLGAVCDIRPEAAKKLADENGVPHFGSVKDMLAADVIDAVTISTPSGFHLDAALESVEGGKHALVEKPLEITTDRIDQIITAKEKQGVTVGCVHQSRFRPVVLKLKKLFENGLLGDIYSGSVYIKRYRTQEYYDSGGWRGTWKVDGGGCLMNQGIHDVDLFRWFLGDVEQVIAMTDNVGRNVEVETLALALVKFASGAKGVVEGSTVAYPELPTYLEIFGSRGTVTFSANKLMRMDIIDPTDEETAARDELLALTKTHEEERARNAKKSVAGTAVPSLDMGHTPVITDFVEAIQAGREPFVSVHEARNAVELITAIYESGRNNSKPVRLKS